MVTDNLSPVETSKAGHVASETCMAPVLAPALPAAAERALAEAALRRAALVQANAANAVEFCGRGGLEPVRYGDWEVKGIACDF